MEEPELAEVVSVTDWAAATAAKAATTAMNFIMLVFEESLTID